MMQGARLYIERGLLKFERGNFQRNTMKDLDYIFLIYIAAESI